MSLEGEIKVLQDNIKLLQGQLAESHKRIMEILKERDHALEDLKQEKQMYADLSDRLEKTDLRAQEMIKDKMESIPEVLDSKPMTFKKPPLPSYTVKEGEKWVTIKDGKMEFEDIEIKD